MKNKLGLVTGSFDPITVGHFDIITRASRIFERVIVVVAHNDEKEYMFTPAQRLAIVSEAIKDIPNAEAMLCDGLVADFAIEHGADAFVRGIRDGADVAYEQNMAGINYANSGVDTVMLFAKPEFHEISSTRVRKAILSGESLLELMPFSAAVLAKQMLSVK
ncbi:MAG: pantetheine-phosphate adenylyltransferase [Clostridia bacterium]|nr:pantetheine-phosphate adenylyltransferase [Clostridia bacterium]